MPTVQTNELAKMPESPEALLLNRRRDWDAAVAEAERRAPTRCEA